VLYGGYTNQCQTIKRIDEIVAHDYPIDAYWIDSWFWSFDNKGAGPAKYIDFVADTVGFPNRKAMWNYMEQRKIKGGFWIWDCIFETGNESAFMDFDERGFFRNKYIENNPWHNYSTTTAMFQTEGKRKGTLCGNIDFKNLRAITYFKQKMKPFFDEGADFLKLDRTSAIEVCKTMFEISQEFGRETRGRGFMLSHTGGQESEEYKRYPAKWTDDTRSDWNIEQPTKDFNPWVPAVALKENIAMFTDSEKRSSKIPFLANDLGGFDMGKTDKPDEELYIRWLQFSMFSPVVEVFAQPENQTSNMAYLISERADKLFRKYSHLRMELFPYIYSYAHKVRLEGKQMMQALPRNPFDYMFGNELFVAPVYEQGATKRLVELPAGKWLNYWTNEKLEGGRKIEVNAPLDQIPFFVREGSIIPMRKYASSIEKGTNDTLIVHIYPGANSEFTLIEDDGLSNDYLVGKIACTRMKLQTVKNNCIFSIEPIEGHYEKMNNLRVVKLITHTDIGKIQKITHNGDKVPFERVKDQYETVYLQINKKRTSTFIVHCCQELKCNII
jgi:alpha-glucosidase (family GH31 glycosyl hydrolase)